MPSPNGHGPKRAVLYARVSTDEQARSGYSLAQQLEVLREYAARQGYEVVEEVADPGESGVSLQRPGMDRVRDLVDAGGINVVVAQDRDRIARKPAYNYLLQEELTERGCELRALNDYGDDSPEGKLMRGIQDQFAEYEHAKIFERTRRGKLKKAKEGKLLRNSRAHYGFKFTSAGDAYFVDEEEMRVVRRIFRQMAESQTLHGIKRSLEREGVSPPEGGRYWNMTFLRSVALSDVYRPHTYAEIEELVTPEVAARLDEEKLYGVFWYNRARATRKRISNLGPDGREYRWSTTRRENPREQWIAIPVPDAGVPYDTWRAARDAVSNNRVPSKARLREFWELSGGIFRCSGCNNTMRPTASKVKGRSTLTTGAAELCATAKRPAPPGTATMPRRSRSRCGISSRS